MQGNYNVDKLLGQIHDKITKKYGLDKEPIEPKIKIDSWDEDYEIADSYGSSDGNMRSSSFTRNSSQENAGEVFNFHNDKFLPSITIPEIDPKKIITKIQEIFSNRCSQFHELKPLAEKYCEKLLEKIKEKLPKVEIIENPYYIDRSTIEESKQFTGNQLEDLFEKKAIKVGKGIIENPPKPKFGSSDRQLVEIISLDDAKKNNIPFLQFEGSMLVHFPEKKSLIKEYISYDKKEPADGQQITVIIKMGSGFDHVTMRTSETMVASTSVPAIKTIKKKWYEHGIPKTEETSKNVMVKLNYSLAELGLEENQVKVGDKFNFTVKKTKRKGHDTTIFIPVEKYGNNNDRDYKRI